MPRSKTPRWRPQSLALIFLAWLILQFGGLFSPGLLDDVDSVYLQIAREMLQRHDFVTPTIDGIRFFDKPPLMYWMAAASMRLFGTHDWAARLPLALGVLALLLAVYALANYLYAAPDTAQPWGAPGPDPRTRDGKIVMPATDRPGLYAALAMATAIGPYLYTRFYIPDILIALWMTLSIHLFLIAIDRIEDRAADSRPSPLLPMLGFAAVLALDVLTKGLIGVVFPILFVLLYLAFTHRLRDLAKLHLPAATLAFTAIAAPWHILAALRNPAIAMPAGLGLPPKAGWAWFYLYNEHIARFLGRRIPHDYGKVPVPLFWLLLVLWLVPWAAFLPAALTNAIRTLWTPRDTNLRFDSDADFAHASVQDGSFTPSHLGHEWATTDANRPRDAALILILWPAIVLGFFTLSSRQEYYHLPALPALAILVAGLLTTADTPLAIKERAQTLRASLYLLVPLGTLLSAVCGYFAIKAPTPAPGATLSSLLSSNPEFYNLSLGHLFDLTGQAMGLFRGPLIVVSLGMITLGPIAHVVRRKTHTFAANLLITAAMTAVLLAAHAGLVRFNPILGSKDLALAINTHAHPGDLILIDGELTSGSTLLFYTDLPVHLVNGRRNGPWFGSFWPDAPQIFEDDATLRRLWSGPRRIYLLTYDVRTPDPTLPVRELTTAEREAELTPLAPVHAVAHSGGKTILTNQPN
jgi:4-amino-4-deoxy-L-arabinose transferase-like glycosyltransferase